jgi:hypothetical protein
VSTCSFHVGKIGISFLTKIPTSDANLQDSSGSSGLLPPTIDERRNLDSIPASLATNIFPTVGPLVFLDRGATTKLSITSSYQGRYIYIYIYIYIFIYLSIKYNFITENETISIGKCTFFGVGLILRGVVYGRTNMG